MYKHINNSFEFAKYVLHIAKTFRTDFVVVTQNGNKIYVHFNPLNKYIEYFINDKKGSFAFADYYGAVNCKKSDEEEIKHTARTVYSYTESHGVM